MSEHAAVVAWRELIQKEPDLSEWAGSDPGRKAKVAGVMQEAFGQLREASLQGNPTAFAITCMGKMPADHQSKWRQAANRRRVLILGPRDHGKSFVFAQWVALEELARRPESRILLVRMNLDMARKSLGGIKQIVEKGSEFRRQYGNIRGHRWTQTEIYRRGNVGIDPSVEAVGPGVAITGNRANLIICDDIVDPLAVRTETQRAKLKDWFYGTLLELLEPGGRCIVIGTRKHSSDLYGHLIKEDQQFTYIHDRAIDVADVSAIEHEVEFGVQDGKRVATGVKVLDPDPPAVLWPQRWSLEALLLKRAGMGSRLFSQENQNEVIDDDSALFKRGHLERCRNERLWYFRDGADGQVPAQLLAGRFRLIVQSWDLSATISKRAAEEGDRDYTVGYTVGVDDQGKRWVLNVVRERGITYAGMQNLVRVQYGLYLPAFVIVEANVFQNQFVGDMVQQFGIPIVPHTTTASKHDVYSGIPSMSIQFENGHYVFPYKDEADRVMTNLIFDEFHGFTVERHDDLVMALWFVEAVLPRYMAHLDRGEAAGSRAMSF